MRRPTALLLATALTLPTLALAACGGGGDDEDPAKEARAVAEAYGRAVAAKNYQEICDGLLATVLVTKLNDSGLPCEVAMKTALEDLRKPTLTVLSVQVNKDIALVKTRSTAEGQEPAEEGLKLVREKQRGWRIEDLATAQPAAPRPRTP